MAKKYLFDAGSANSYYITMENNERIDFSFCVFTENDPDHIIPKEATEDINIIIKKIKKANPQNLRLGSLRDEHVQLILPFIKHIKNLSIHSAYLTDFTFIEELKEIQGVEIIWNLKATSLWDMKKNPLLKFVHMTNANKLVNFNGLISSNVEHLAIYGCNYFSSFTPKLEIPDPSFLLKMPKLKELELHIKKTESDSWYLSFFSKFTFLNRLNIPYKYFSFEEFALLSKNLPFTKGLEPYWKLGDKYHIIGRRTPSVETIEEARKWETKYNEIKNR